MISTTDSSSVSPADFTDSERQPILGAFGAIEAMLREPRRLICSLKETPRSPLIAILLAISVFSSGLYGLIVGAWSGGAQLWAAPVKIISGSLASGVICLPSLYIFSCLSGSRARLVDVIGLLSTLLALTGLLLIGFAPVAWVFSQSTESLFLMGGFHILFWLVGTWFGLRFVEKGFEEFCATSKAGLKVWTILFLLVCLQMTAALRPIVGRSSQFLPSPAEKKFFVRYWWDCMDAEQKRP